MNITVLCGHLSRPSQRRTLADEETVLELDVTVPRRDDVPSETVNVVWPGAPAKADELDTDDEVVVVGRVRRRFFRSAGATTSRTEVVASQVLRARQAKSADRLIADAIAVLEDGRARR
jgi:single-strand DNA-binding protein